jgi:hypothetical protein
MARSPLTDTITRVQGMITYVRENLSTDEYNLFLDLLVPEQEAPSAKPKRKRKKAAASTTSGNSRRGLPASARVALPHCVHEYPSGELCSTLESNTVHDQDSQYVLAHPFVAPTTAPRARNQSSRNGEGLPAGVSSEINTVGAGSAAGGSGE